MPNLENIKFRFLLKEEFESIIPYVSKLNPKLSRETIWLRLDEMKDQGVRCIGVFDSKKLIGMCSVWVQTRFYCGKMIEPDNVYIENEYRSLGLGKLLIEFLEDTGKKENCEVSELNCYLDNEKGLKFWRNQGYKELGFHMQKKIYN